MNKYNTGMLMHTAVRYDGMMMMIIYDLEKRDSDKQILRHLRRRV
jgi:hypothetical protein